MVIGCLESIKAMDEDWMEKKAACDARSREIAEALGKGQQPRKPTDGSSYEESKEFNAGDNSGLELPPDLPDNPYTQPAQPPAPVIKEVVPNRPSRPMPPPSSAKKD